MTDLQIKFIVFKHEQKGVLLMHDKNRDVWYLPSTDKIECVPVALNGICIDNPVVEELPTHFQASSWVSYADEDFFDFFLTIPDNIGELSRKFLEENNIMRFDKALLDA
jgi:hypothetical protein